MTLFLTFLVLALAGAAAVTVTGTRRVRPGHVGVVHRHWLGRTDPRDDPNVKFLGGLGPQAKVLKSNRMYIRPRVLFDVSEVPQTRVPAGTIGVVVAKTGKHAPPEQVLCRHVACDNFQDGEAFLIHGGQQGRQPGILVEGVYDINPLLFEVLTVETIGTGRYGLTAADLREIEVPDGSTGVVMTRVGEPPDESDGSVGRRVPGHHNFQHPWAFLSNGGERGAQEETLGRGVYRINPWFARVILIPTRYLSLEWTRRENKPASNYDAALDQIVVNVDGHRLRFEMTQIIRIPQRAAPLLVGRFGADQADIAGGGTGANPVPVQRFVERVLGSTVEGYFHGNAAGYTVLDFLQQHDEVRLELEECVRQALKDWGVEAVRTTLTAFESEDGDLDAFRRTIATARDRRQVVRHDIVTARDEAEAERIRLDTERERRRLAVVELEERCRVLGIDVATMEVLLTQLAKMKGPEFIGGDAGEAMQYTPLAAAQKIINRVLLRQEPAIDDAPSGSITPE